MRFFVWSAVLVLILAVAVDWAPIRAKFRDMTASRPTAGRPTALDGPYAGFSGR